MPYDMLPLKGTSQESIGGVLEQLEMLDGGLQSQARETLTVRLSFGVQLNKFAQPFDEV